MHLREWEREVGYWAEMAYRGTWVIEELGLKGIPQQWRGMLWQLEDYTVSSVSKGRIWLKEKPCPST
jgi:hypothetical protein